MIGNLPIENCRLKFECRQRWDSLEVITSQPDVRYCSQCKQAVHRVRTESEFRLMAAAGRCVALSGLDGPMRIGEAGASFERTGSGNG